MNCIFPNMYHLPLVFYLLIYSPVILDSARESMESRTLCSCCLSPSVMHSSESLYHCFSSCLKLAPCSRSSSWIFLLLAGPGWLPYAESPSPSWECVQYMSVLYLLLPRLLLPPLPEIFDSTFCLISESVTQGSFGLLSSCCWKIPCSPNLRISWVI